MAWTIPWNLIGIIVSGDFADLTIYTDRFGRKVCYPKSPPTKPPTAAQINQRNRFKTAQAAYMALTAAQRAAYENATLRASASCTGQNVFISVAMRHDIAALRTLEKQSGITLVNPPLV